METCKSGSEGGCRKPVVFLQQGAFALPNDFLKSEEIEGILGNSDFVYLLNQNAKDQAILADKLGLSEKQLAHVTNSEPGSGLILFDNVVIPFVDKYPKDTKTYAIMNTKPEESVKQEENS